MDVVLTVEQGQTRTKKIRLRREATTIGRRRDCTLCVPSAEVSRRHCVLRCQDGYLTVEDLDSVNGTYLNDARIKGKEVVYPGDRLAIGPLKFIVQYQLSKSARNLLQATSPTAEPFDFRGASEQGDEPPTVKAQPSGDFEIVQEIAEADLAEDIQDAELIDVTENSEPGLVEIIDDPDAVEIVDDPQAVEVVSEADVVEIIDNPEVVEGSSLMKARENVEKPVVKKKTPSGKARR